MGGYTPAAAFADLRAHGSELEAIEVVMIAAWQAAGLRAIHSWKREESLDSTLPLAQFEGEPDEGYALAPAPVEDAGVAQELLARYADQWAPPRRWGEYLAAAPHVLWGWTAFHRVIWEDGVNDLATKAACLVYLAAFEGHADWTVGIERDSEAHGLTEAQIEQLRDCRADDLRPDMQAACRYVEEMTYSEGVSEDVTRAAADALGPGGIVELGMFAGLHLASIRVDTALRRAA